MARCKANELIDEFDKMGGKSKAQDQFDEIVNNITGNRTRTSKTPVKEIRKEINELVKTISSTADCEPTKKSQSTLKAHIREIAIDESSEDIARENF